MDHAVNIGVFLEDLVETGFLGDIDVVELWPLAADELDAVDDLFGRIIQIVCDHNFVVCLKEGECGERANVTTPSTTELLQGARLTEVFAYVPRNEH